MPQQNAGLHKKEDIKEPSPLPLGIMPMEIWISKRVNDLLEAMERYTDAGKIIPPAWLSELKHLINGSWQKTY